MMNNSKPYILFVDGDSKVRKAVSEILRKAGFKASCFNRVSDCLKHLYRHLRASCPDGVQKRSPKSGQMPNDTKETNPPLLILVAAGYENIATLVSGLEAATFVPSLKRPESQISASDVERRRTRIAIISPLGEERLTGTEAKILRLILEGKTNSEMAHLLHRSVRTIEKHRRAIMSKLNVDNLVDLVKKSGLVHFEVTREADICNKITDSCR